jgi:hypothetical protein
MTKVERTFLFITAFSAMNGLLVQNALSDPIIEADFRWGRSAVIEVTFIPEEALTATARDKTPLADNLFVYRVTNLPWEGGPIVELPEREPIKCIEPCHGTSGESLYTFRVANPDHFDGVILDLPEGWSGSVSAEGFVWQTTDGTDAHGIPQGGTLKFFLYSPGPYGVSTGQAWFGSRTAGAKASGPVSGPLQPVPEPSTLLLLGAGLVAFGRRIRGRRQ